MGLQNTRKNFMFRALSLIQAAVFIFSSFALPAKVYAQSVMELPAPGSMVNPSVNYVPVILRAVKIHPDQPLVFDFMVDSGNTQADQPMIKAETKKLVKYFLASLTIPEQDLWVNLSPYEHDRIVPEVFGQTEMGRDLLAQDYMLKQLTASLVDPEKDLGREFWSRVYAKARETLGTAEIPVDTFNKVWIMPDKAEIYEMDNTAMVGQSRLKVLMEEDYLALQKTMGIERDMTSEDSASRQISNDVMRQVVLPEIEKEVNEGKNFALLRQVYQSLVLAAWYKNNLKESLLAQVYADQNKTAGMNVDKADKEAIYQRYIAAYKQGVFNYIKEDVDPVTNEVLPRKYFSGGANFKEIRRAVVLGTKKVYSGAAIPPVVQMPVGGWNQVTVAMAKPDAAEITTGKDTEVFVNKLHLAGFDKGYLQGLFAKYLSGKLNAGAKKALIIGKNFIPSALMSGDDRKKFLGAWDYKTQVREEKYLEAARNAVLWADEMNGGLGTSLARERYLKVNFDRENIGAKGTDMYFFLDLPGFNESGSPVTVKEPVSTAELKYLQVLKTSGQYGKVIMQELVNDESLEPMRKFLNETVYLPDRLDKRPGALKRTYREVLTSSKNIVIPQEIIQASLPVIDVQQDALTDEFLAPGGHGQLGSMALQDVLTEKLPEHQVLIRTLYNGDGTNNAPDPYIVGWMAKENIPIVMISTTKTVLDKKGGLIGGEKLEAGGYVADMLELAQAKANQQQAVFSEMGLTQGELGGQFFNTNIALVNYSVLQPFLKELRDMIGPEKYAQMVTPDLILNEKEKGADKKKVVQLEGAMGSALLNVNRFCVTTDDARVRDLMKKYGFDRLLYIVNVDQKSRDEFFTPVKYAWDHWLYAYSGHFKIDQDTWKLSNNVPGHLPGFGDMDRYYEDLQNVIDSFGDANVDSLDEISINGIFKFRGAVLQGKIKLENNSGTPVDLNQHKEFFKTSPEGRLVIEDVHVTVGESGIIEVKAVDAAAFNRQDNKSAPEMNDVRDNWKQGGIDLNPAALNLNVTRTGKGIQVQFDPAEVQRIKTEGVSGFTPVIINITPVKSLLPALGLAPAEPGLVGAAS